MALDAYEGEQKLNHTESNREHLWRLLQGGELIAPVPPLPPLPSDGSGVLSREDGISPPPPSPVSEDAVPAASPVKKTRSRKKVEVTAPDQEQGSVPRAESGAESAPALPKRRGKKTEANVLEDGETRIKAPSKGTGETSSGLVDAKDSVSPTKPKRYAVGEPEKATTHEESMS